jgi:uncharacterized membrane protein
MTIEAAQAVALIVATITMGLMAGVFGLYSNTIMRGLGATDDRTFVGAFGAIDRAIINPLFMLTFLGALVSTGVTAALYLADDGGSVLPWVVVAFVLYLAVVVITIGINVPLNDALKAAGDPDRIADLAAVRRDFNESHWVAWNHVRTVATLVAFGCLAWGLVLHGRDTASTEDGSASVAATELAAPAPDGG